MSNTMSNPLTCPVCGSPLLMVVVERKMATAEIDPMLGLFYEADTVPLSTDIIRVYCEKCIRFDLFAEFGLSAKEIESAIAAEKVRRAKPSPNDLDSEQRAYLDGELQKLLQFTRGCRIDMHEPDEQCLDAEFDGYYFDNAGCSGELHVILHEDVSDETGPRYNTLKINLANLIALARLANLGENHA